MSDGPLSDTSLNGAIARFFPALYRRQKAPAAGSKGGAEANSSSASIVKLLREHGAEGHIVGRGSPGNVFAPAILVRGKTWTALRSVDLGANKLTFSDGSELHAVELFTTLTAPAAAADVRGRTSKDVLDRLVWRNLRFLTWMGSPDRDVARMFIDLEKRAGNITVPLVTSWWDIQRILLSRVLMRWEDWEEERRAEKHTQRGSAATWITYKQLIESGIEVPRLPESEERQRAEDIRRTVLILEREQGPRHNAGPALEEMIDEMWYPSEQDSRERAILWLTEVAKSIASLAKMIAEQDVEVHATVRNSAESRPVIIGGTDWRAEDFAGSQSKDKTGWNDQYGSFQLDFLTGDVLRVIALPVDRTFIRNPHDDPDTETEIAFRDVRFAAPSNSASTTQSEHADAVTRNAANKAKADAPLMLANPPVEAESPTDDATVKAAAEGKKRRRPTAPYWIAAQKHANAACEKMAAVGKTMTKELYLITGLSGLPKAQKDKWDEGTRRTRFRQWLTDEKYPDRALVYNALPD